MHEESLQQTGSFKPKHPGPRAFLLAGIVGLLAFILYLAIAGHPRGYSENTPTVSGAPVQAFITTSVLRGKAR